MALVSREVDRLHRSLLVKLGDMMDPSSRTYKNFIRCLESDILQRGRLSTVQQNPTDVFALMEEKGVLKVGNYDSLKEALKDSGYINILDVLNKEEECITRQMRKRCFGDGPVAGEAAAVSSIGAEGPEDYTPSCKESARTTTSSSCQPAMSEVKVEKLQNSLDDNSAADDEVIPVPRCLFYPSGPSSGNMKAQFDETDAICNQRLLVDLARSVGIIKSPYGPCGTGFRVGIDYIMTAKHVKDDILNAAPVQFDELSPSSRINHLSNAFIDFAYEVHGVPTDDNLRFYFKPEIVYENEDMDIVILRLESSMLREYPPPMTFAELSDPCGQLYFIGHSRADIKKTDKFRCVKLINEEVTAAVRWSFSYVGVNGFIGIDNPHRLLFHCTFEKGASGSPGVWIYHKNQHTYAKVVTVLLCGFPDWYYDTNYPQEKKIRIPKHICVEQGVCIKSLYEDMKVTKPDLWWEIFVLNANNGDN